MLKAVVLIVVSTLSISCEKEKAVEIEVPEVYNIKFKVDGVQNYYTYTEGMKFLSNQYGEKMYGDVRVNINPYPFIRFEFSNANNFTFKNKAASDTLGFMTYNEGPSDNKAFLTPANYDLTIQNKDFVFTLTERAATHVRGTFSGTVFNYSDSQRPPISKKITEGTFYLNIGSQ